MKRLSGAGIGSKRKQAEVISEEEEELLWTKGLLGEVTPQQLLYTIIFYNGLFLPLAVGKNLCICATLCVKLRWWRTIPSCVHRGHFKESVWWFEGLKYDTKGCTPPCQYRKSTTVLPTTLQKYRSLCSCDALPNAFYIQSSHSHNPGISRKHTPDAGTKSAFSDIHQLHSQFLCWLGSA